MKAVDHKIILFLGLAMSTLLGLRAYHHVAAPPASTAQPLQQQAAAQDLSSAVKGFVALYQ